MSRQHRSSVDEIAALFARGSTYTAVSAVQLSIHVLVLPFVTRLLSKSAYGRVTAALVVVQLLTYVAALGFPSVVTLEYFGRRGGLPAARALILITLACAAAIALVADLLGPLWARNLFSGLEYDLVLRVAVWSAVPMALLLAVQALLRAQDRALAFVVVTLVGTAGAQVLGVGAAVVWKPTASTYVVGVAAGLVLSGLVGLRLTGIDLSRVGDGALIRSALKLGLPTVPHAIAIYVVAAGDRVLVERELGLPSVARYQVAYLVGALGLTLAGAFNNAWSTLVYGARDEDRWQVLADTTAELYRLIGFVVGAIALGGPVALGVLAPSAYSPLRLAPVCAVVAISAIPYVDYLANSHAIFYCRRAWSLAWITPLAAAVNVAVNLLLLPHLGLIGAAYATVAGYVVQAALARIVRSRFLHVPWRAGMARRAWALGVTCACAGALLPSRGAWLVVRAVLTGGVLTVLAVQVRRTLTRGR